jgi:hypothetical protein
VAAVWPWATSRKEETNVCWSVGDNIPSIEIDWVCDLGIRVSIMMNLYFTLF